MTSWLINEAQSVSEKDLESSLPAPASLRSGSRANLALRLNDLVVHDTRKWFGGADIRLDTIVVHGPPSDDGEAEPYFYQPTTFRFGRVRDGDRLPVEAPGLLAFYGRPRLFLDVAVLVSRDRKDAADLAALIAKNLNSEEWKSGAEALRGLSVAAPPAAAVLAALSGAGAIANFVADLLGRATSGTIGLYRASFLQHRDRFGLGRHPDEGSYRGQDFSFWYEVILDRAPSS